MTRGVVNHFNRGEIDPEALAREDLKRVNNSASYMSNFIPMRLGPMMFRPGFEYIVGLSSTPHYLIPFVTTIDSPVMLDFTDGAVSFIVDDIEVSSSAVTTVFTNGDFASDISGWTDASAGSGSIAYYSGSLALTGDGSSDGSAYQTLTTEVDTQHSIKIEISRAPCTVKIGTSGAASYDLFSGELKPGTHILTFTPDANITVTFENSLKYRALIDSVSFLGDEQVSIPTTVSDLASLRYRQSIDVMFFAASDSIPFQVERRGNKSWSVVEYRANDGPLAYINTSSIALTPGALSGDTTLASSADYFDTSDIGRIFKLLSSGQTVTASVSVDTGAGTESIRVTGVDSSRIFNITATIPGGTVTLQRSTDDALWEDIESYSSSKSKSFNDEYDNSILYYRLWVKAGNNAGLDSITLKLVYSGGEIEGYCRVTEYTSATSVNIQVTSDFGGLSSTLDWYAGDWYDDKYPTAVDVYEGRLWYGRDDTIYGSVSDSYYSHDASLEGDSAAIKKTVGFGAVSSLRWIKSGLRLILGTLLDEITVRSSSYGEVLTASNANVKSGTNQGSGNVDPAIIDNIVYFIQRSGVKLYALQTYSESDNAAATDVNLLNRTITNSGIVRVAATRQPETRLYCVLGDGTMAIHTVDDSEEVAAWSRLSVDGLIKDVIVLPDEDEDRVYIVVLRGSDYSLQKLAKYSDASTRAFDCHVNYESAGTMLTGLDHLEGEEVSVIGNNLLIGSYTVSGGSINVPANYAVACVGIPYSASYISNKLSGYQSETVLTERKRVVDTGLVMMNYYHSAVTVGPTADHLKKIPRIKRGIAQSDADYIAEYNELPFPFDGNTESDPRIHIGATAPCIILALTYGIESKD